MAGHYRPLFLRFEKGGKMVATAGGVFFGVAVLAALAASVVWILAFALTRYTSVASIAAALSAPVWAVVFEYPPAVIVLSCASAAGVIFLHRSNLRRLRSGTENRFRPRTRSRHAAPQ
jgi:glycerol-3-phosphate acyltransferase PlsY